MKNKLSEYELSVLLAQQIFGLEDLHFGVWEQDITPSITNLPRAQQRYVETLRALLPDATAQDIHLLYAGCGTGMVINALSRLGYRVDGCTSYHSLYKLASQKLSQSDPSSQLFNVAFDRFPAADYEQRYDVVVISEQIVPTLLTKTLRSLEQIIKPGGLCVMFNFFSVDQQEGVPDSNTCRLSALKNAVEHSSFTLVQQQNISEYIAPNLMLMDEYLLNHVTPALQTLSQYANQHYPLMYNTLGKLMRRKWQTQNDLRFPGKQYASLQSGALRYYLIVLQRVKPA